MVKYDNESHGYLYYDDKTNKHEFKYNISNEEAAKIISDLLLCNKFLIDTTVLGALYIGMRKLQGYSDEEIQKMYR